MNQIHSDQGQSTFILIKVLAKVDALYLKNIQVQVVIDGDAVVVT